MHDHFHEIVTYFFELAQLPEAVFQGVGRGFELEKASHARAEDEAIVRLGQKIVAASLDGLHPIAGVVERRDEYHWNARRARVALDTPADLEAGGPVVTPQVAGWHRDIENAKVGAMRGRRFNRRRSVLGGDRAIAEHVELVEQQLHVGGHVVRHENERALVSHCAHGVAPRLMAAP